MIRQVQSSSEFASLVNKLQQEPDNSGLKKELVKRLPAMKAKAEEDPLALYQLAQIYPPKSVQYKQMMRQSANRGCTNAMLVLCRILAESGSSVELKTAVHFMKMIEQSKDSHIINLSKNLIEEYPQLAKALNFKSKTQGLGFFSEVKKERIQEIPQSVSTKSLK